jgi:hypothetical protein
VIRGHNDYGGVLPADSVLSMRPPLRSPCRRLQTRMMLLADGRAVLCSQDVRGETAFGRWGLESLADLWQGAGLGAAREAHSRLTFDNHPLCDRCWEWFRP